jgi:hypothetical protein
MKNFQLIKELMDDFNIFVNANQTIEPDVATKIAEKHGFVLEKERREKGGGVQRKKRLSLLRHLRSRRKRRNSSPARPSLHSWAMSITAKLPDGCDSENAGSCRGSGRDYTAHRRLPRGV